MKHLLKINKLITDKALIFKTVIYLLVVEITILPSVLTLLSELKSIFYMLCNFVEKGLCIFEPVFYIYIGFWWIFACL